MFYLQKSKYELKLYRGYYTWEEKIVRKKILSVLLILIFIIYFINPVKVFAETISVNKYVAFGDSIAAGYALDDVNDGYVNLVTKSLNTTSENYAVSGMNSTEFLELLETNKYETQIKEADLITVSIGSNDLLGRMQEIACDAFGINKDEVVDIIPELKEAFANASATEKLTMIQKFYTSLTTQETTTMFQQAISGYEQNWKNIVQTLKELNSSAKIIATEFYNPFYGVTIPLVGGDETINFSDYAETYISQMNQILNSNTTDYVVAKIHDKFDTKGLTNVNISLTDFNIDPHPNVEGHKVIADTIIDLLQGAEEAKDISECNFSEIKDQTYTGEAIEPEIEITDEAGNVLAKNKDYEVEYSNNIDIGQATVTVNGIGNYTGTYTINFEIIEDKTGNNNTNTSDSNNNSNNEINNNTNNINNSINDNTVSQIKLPFTGDTLKTIIIVGIIVAICFAVGIKIKEKYYNI